MLVPIFVYLVLNKERENPLKRGSPMRVLSNSIASHAMSGLASVPREINGPRDGNM